MMPDIQKQGILFLYIEDKVFMSIYRYKIMLHLTGINLTEVLESALTLRQLVTRKVEQLCNTVLRGDIAATVSNIWMEGV